MLKGKKILIGISGGIAVYKICSLINLIKKEAGVAKVIMTNAAIKFVTPLTFRSLTGDVVHIDLFDSEQKTDVEHINLADWCDLYLIAPATYNTINKIANGVADNLLTTVSSAVQGEVPILFVPAMNCHMWENPILKKNIDFLKSIKINNKSKYFFVGPEKGPLVCGYDGEGKIIGNQEIINKIAELIK
jgi:phosphopantothenoylcysteine decarboxylase/phosphopantothenate--cysteine ligase